mmetsp:Transcript_62818/g.178447  ORF Transcript_62818/g.178447 Transcript_62818/m.178447 type:complete len:219 (+) Transcript_62818:1353-2009(+)
MAPAIPGSIIPTRQSLHPSVTRVATKPPSTTLNWKSPPVAPRIPGVAISELYIGSAKQHTPTPKPVRNRPTMKRNTRPKDRYETRRQPTKQMLAPTEMHGRRPSALVSSGPSTRPPTAAAIVISDAPQSTKTWVQRTFLSAPWSGSGPQVSSSPNLPTHHSLRKESKLWTLPKLPWSKPNMIAPAMAEQIAIYILLFGLAPPSSMEVSIARQTRTGKR